MFDRSFGPAGDAAGGGGLVLDRILCDVPCSGDGTVGLTRADI
jgi:16S rRNA C967 or C1407 C5-methylase (RsmB/RsmF family)